MHMHALNNVCTVTVGGALGQVVCCGPVVAPSPSVECLHVVLQNCVPTHGEGQPPLALDPFTAITPVSV